MKLKLIILSLIFGNLANSAGDTHFSLPNEIFLYDKNELLFAERFHAFLRGLEKFQYNVTLGRNLLLTKTNLFQQEQWQIKLFISAMAKKDYREQIHACLNDVNNQKDYASAVITQFCHLFLISNLNGVSENIDKFQQYLPKILENNSLHGHLVTALQSISEEEKITSLSDSIMSFYLEKNLTPGQNLLDAIKINQNFTIFLQHNNYYNQINKKYFHQQLHSLFQDTYLLIKENNIPRGIENTEEILAFFGENVDFITADYFVKNFLLLLRQLNTNEYLDKIMSLLLQLAQTLPNHDHENINRVYFEALWNYLALEKYPEGLSLLKELDILKKRYSTLDTRFKFWIAYLLNKNDEEKLASTIYNEIMAADPFNYYAVVASALNKDSKLQIPIQKRNLSKDTMQILLSDKKNIEYLQKIKIYIDAKETNSLRDSISDLLNHQLSTNNHEMEKEGNPGPQEVVSLLAKFLSANKKHLETFKLLNYRFNDNNLMLDEVLLKAIFPQDYRGLIHSVQSQIDHKLILSILRQESAFNPRAKSKAGAMGLMQVMPNTARSLNKRIKAHQLYHPKTNLNIGIKYFNKMLQLFDNNTVYALAAYNAGPHRVTRWKSQLFTSNNPLINIEAIPFSETRNYVQYILRNYYFYNLIYQDNEQLAATKISNIIQEKI